MRLSAISLMMAVPASAQSFTQLRCEYIAYANVGSAPRNDVKFLRVGAGYLAVYDKEAASWSGNRCIETGAECRHNDDEYSFNKGTRLSGQLVFSTSMSLKRRTGAYSYSIMQHAGFNAGDKEEQQGVCAPGYAPKQPEQKF
jgi:hypothetical protein